VAGGEKGQGCEEGELGFEHQGTQGEACQDRPVPAQQRVRARHAEGDEDPRLGEL